MSSEDTQEKTEEQQADDGQDEPKETTEEQQGDEGQDEPQGEEGQSDAHKKAVEAEEKHQRARETMEEIDKNPPDKLEDWPDDEAKYETFGGSDSESEYDEHHEEVLGEHSVRHHEDGTVEVKGEKADNPDEYKGEPIPGGPTDPEAPPMPGEEKMTDDASGDDEKQTDEASGEQNESDEASGEEKDAEASGKEKQTAETSAEQKDDGEKND